MRLDKAMLERGLVATRSQAESFIRMGKVLVDGREARKSGQEVADRTDIRLMVDEHYVSRAGYKLASIARDLKLDFTDKVVLDVGSSTGGFSDFALQHGARRVYAVDVGTEQLHPSLRGDSRIELHEKTDIRDFTPEETPDIVVMDVSFISSREILPHLAQIGGSETRYTIMVKPQFEAGKGQVSGGVIKNDRVRREILRDFEQWARGSFVIIDKADSDVAGSRGNQERFYLLKKLGF